MKEHDTYMLLQLCLFGRRLRLMSIKSNCLGGNCHAEAQPVESWFAAPAPQLSDVHPAQLENIALREFRDAALHF